MTRRFSGFLCAIVGVALVSGSCVQDPLADLDGTPAAIITSHSTVQLTQGAAGIAVTAQVVDGRSVPLALPITFTACDAAVSVVPDPTFDPVPATAARDIVSGVSPAASCVNVAAGGLTKQVTAIVLPTSFSGTASGTTLQTGQTLTLSSTPTLRFDSTNANIDFGGGFTGTVVTRTGSSLAVIVPLPGQAQPAPLRVQNVNVTYVSGLRVTLPTAANFTVTNPHDPNDLPGPATTVTPPADTIYEGFAAGEADNFYTFTLAGSTTFTVTIDWATSAADLDLLFCNAACSAFVGNFDGATTANPETSTVTLPAGTYNLYINNFTPTVAVPLYRVQITP